MNGLMAEKQAAMGAASGMAPPSGGGSPAGLTQGQGSPPPTAPMGQYPAGAASPQMQPTPGFQELASKMLEVLVQGNEADLQIFGQMVGQLEALAENHQGAQAPQAQVPLGAAPQGPVVP